MLDWLIRSFFLALWNMIWNRPSEIHLIMIYMGNPTWASRSQIDLWLRNTSFHYKNDLHMYDLTTILLYLLPISLLSVTHPCLQCCLAWWTTSSYSKPARTLSSLFEPGKPMNVKWAEIHIPWLFVGECRSLMGIHQFIYTCSFLDLTVGCGHFGRDHQWMFMA